MKYFINHKIWLIVIILSHKIFSSCQSHENLLNIIKEIRIYQFINILKSALKINNEVKVVQFNLNKIIHEDKKNNSSIESYFHLQNEGSCSRRNLTVNLKEHGFTNILYPYEIDIGFCKGHCDDFKTLSEHAKLLFLSKSETPGKSTCCYPNTFRDIYIYFQKNDKVYAKMINRCVIKSCQCS